jgi:hypothetical protein
VSGPGRSEEPNPEPEPDGPVVVIHVTWCDVRVANVGGQTATIPDGTVLARDVVSGSTIDESQRSYFGGYACCVTDDGQAVDFVAQGDQVVGMGQTLYFTVYVVVPTEGKIGNAATVDPDGVIAERDETNNGSNHATYVFPPRRRTSPSP